MTAFADKLPKGRALLLHATMAWIGIVGCRSNKAVILPTSALPPGYLESITVNYERDQPTIASVESAEPLTDLSELPTTTWEMTLDEAIHTALHNTEILRSLGATVVSNPQSVIGSFDPAIQSTDPFFGAAAALSQFDTQLNSSLLYTKNDDVFNNPVLGGGAAEVRDDVAASTLGLRRTNIFGTQFSMQNRVQHSNSTNPALLFPHSWTTVWEGTVRQPLMQGRGAQFNQIAGPTNQTGFRNVSGVVLSQINQEVSLAQFEKGVRDMVREITNAYWQLDLAYRRLEATKRVRDLGLTTWNSTKARYENGLPGGGADQEALARAQYYQFQSQVAADVSGNLRSGQVGLLQAEANLRRLLGMPQSDDRFIRPIDTPYQAPVIYDWSYLAGHASNARIEIREQSWRVKQREMQLLASRNFLLPRLDLIATYRNNGFGDDLLGGGSGRFASALKDAASNDHGEVDFGVVYDFPVGYRQAQAAVRNAELLLARERSILNEQREQVVFELGNAIRSVYRNQIDLELQHNRVLAARDAVSAREAAFNADTITIDQLLESHERLLEAERAYFDTLLAIQQSHTQLQFESGQLLANNQISLSEMQTVR